MSGLLYCTVCCCKKDPVQMVQLLPCLHMFCADCMNKHKAIFSSVKQRHSKRHDRIAETDEFLICLAQNCYSELKPLPDEQQSLINNCDNEFCTRRLSLLNSNRLPGCMHELCVTCMQEAMEQQTPACPVPTCKEPIEVGEDVCDSCRNVINDEKFIITQCCKARFCITCSEKRFGRKVEPGEENLRCEEGMCIQDRRQKRTKQRSSEKAESMAVCAGREDCEFPALNGFPSNGECDHSVCLQCLERMIDDCMDSGSTPVCPNSLCRQPYSVDSVIALKALLPQKAKYFSGLALENQGYEAIKDDAITYIDISSEFNADDRKMSVKLECEGGDEGTAFLTFDKKGTIADFVREVRRTLKILPLDKVYGYYIRRGEEKNDEKADDKEKRSDRFDEELIVNASSVTRQVAELNLTADCSIMVDMSGIVQAKTPTKSEKNTAV